jgi:CRP-like cAMP-binding protein
MEGILGGMESVASLLLKAPLLEGLEPRALSLIAAVSSRRQVEAGLAIYRKGDEADCLYVVDSGSVRLRLGDNNAELGPGESFGGMALLSDATRQRDAYATSDSELLAVQRDGFRDLIFLHKEIAYEVLWAAVQRLGPSCDANQLVWY